MRRMLAMVSVPALMLSGCGKMAQMARVDPVSMAVQMPSESCKNVAGIGGGKAFAIDLDCYRFPTVGEAPAGDTAYKLATGNLGARLRLESVLLTRADAICEIEKGAIFSNEAASNFFLDFASVSLDAAATIVGGEQAKSILAGLAGVSTATKTNLAANVYKNQVVPAITAVMDGERNRILTEIIARRSETLAQYPADEMIRLVNRYHQACSFQSGIQNLVKASLNKAGSDALVESINLRYAIATLEKQIASDPVPGTTGGIKKSGDQVGGDLVPGPPSAATSALQEQLGRLRLKLSTIAQTLPGDSNMILAEPIQ